MDPVEWNVGDEIVIPSTSHHQSQSENEKKTITAISSDKRTLTLDSNLEAEHVGVEETFDGTLVEMRGEVGLLTHNVVVRGNQDPQWEDEIKACAAGFNVGKWYHMIIPVVHTSNLNFLKWLYAFYQCEHFNNSSCPLIIIK